MSSYDDARKTFEGAPSSSVATIRIVARLIAPPAEDEHQAIVQGLDDLSRYEASFDEEVAALLHDRQSLVGQTLADSLGPDYVVTNLAVNRSNSVELIAVVALAYRVVKDFNEIYETLTHARDHLETVIARVIHGYSRYHWHDVSIVGAMTVLGGQPGVRPQVVLSPTSTAFQYQPLVPTSASFAPRPWASASRQPLEWDRNTFLTRLVVPLLFVGALVALAIGAVAALHHV